MIGKLFQFIDGDGEQAGLHWFKDARITAETVDEWYKEYEQDDPEGNSNFETWLEERNPNINQMRVYVEEINIT